MKKIVSFLILVILNVSFALAQIGTDTLVTKKAMDSGAIDLLKRDGKIYTVIAVLSIILIGIFYYLWRMDKKITALEKK